MAEQHQHAAMHAATVPGMPGPGAMAPAGPALRGAAMAADRWTKCLQCGAFIYYKRLEKNLKVCPECTYHFRLSARERVGYLLDPGSFQERDAEMTPGDPLGFVDTKPYPARISEYRKKSGAKEAAVAANVLSDGSTAYANAIQGTPITQGNL